MTKPFPFETLTDTYGNPVFLFVGIGQTKHSHIEIYPRLFRNNDLLADAVAAMKVFISNLYPLSSCALDDRFHRLDWAYVVVWIDGAADYGVSGSGKNLIKALPVLKETVERLRSVYRAYRGVPNVSSDTGEKQEAQDGA